MATFCNKYLLPFNFKQRKKVESNDNALLRGSKPAGESYAEDPTDPTVDLLLLEDDYQLTVYGYRRNKLFTALNWTLTVLSCGIFGLFCYWCKRLHLFTTHTRCPLRSATKVLAEEKFKDLHKSYHVKKINILDYSSAIENSDFNDVSGWEPDSKNLQNINFRFHTSGGVFKALSVVRYFNCRKTRFVWDPELCQFSQLTGLDNDIPTSYFHQQHGLSPTEQYLRRAVYGANEIVIPQRSLFRLIVIEVLNPFFVFQFFSFIIWCIEEYVLYATAIMIMTIVSVIGSGMSAYFNQRDLHKRVCSSDVVQIIQGDEHVSVPTEQLVPGDILVLPTQGCVMYCDAVLLNGSCITNESSLTGESDPVMKTPIPNASMSYDNKEHGRHTLYGGTEILQTRFYGNKHVLALVVRTGFTTSKGAVIRTLLYPAPTDHKFEQHSYKFVEFLAFIAGAGFLYTVVTKYLRGISVFQIAIESLDLITAAVPPALPAAMTIGAVHALLRLKKKDIFCISPRSINVSGSVNCVCFDKTGTLTEEGLNMWGVIPVKDTKFSSPVRDVNTINPDSDLLYAMVTCHTLTIIREKLCGDPMDLKTTVTVSAFGFISSVKEEYAFKWTNIFESTGWNLEEPAANDDTKYDLIIPTIVKPANSSEFMTTLENQENLLIMYAECRTESDKLMKLMKSYFGYAMYCWMEYQQEIIGAIHNIGQLSYTIGLEIGIVRHFTFSSSLQRMTVIARILGASNYIIYCKGAPESICNLCLPETVPKDFHVVLKHYTRKGYRVIAAAFRPLSPSINYTRMQRLSREDVETDLTFLGLIVLENKLKPETTPVISKLKDANLRLVIVTGDNLLTAVSVGRDCGIILPEQDVISINCVETPNPHIYYTYADVSPVTSSVSSPSYSKRNSDGLSCSSTNLTDITCINSNKNVMIPIDSATNIICTAPRNYVFALTGTDYMFLKQHFPDIIPYFGIKANIFSRMNPEQKQYLVREMQDLGYVVAMCGDGANDCGALKAAHTGISLSNNESSAASPFTSKVPDIRCILSIIKEGRAALVTSFTLFKFMALYSLTQFMSIMILYSIDNNLTDFEYLYIDLFIISCCAFSLGHTRPYEGKLAPKPPPSSLISLAAVASLLCQTVLIFLVQLTSFILVHHYEWFVPFNSEKAEESLASYENYAVFTTSALQYGILAVALHKGPPYVGYICSNHILIGGLVAITTTTVYLIVAPTERVQTFVELKVPPEMNFRLTVLGLGALSLVMSLFIEIVVCDYLISTVLKQRLHSKAKWRKKYANVEHELISKSDWPMISYDVDPVTYNSSTKIANTNARSVHRGSETIPRRLTVKCSRSCSSSVPNVNRRDSLGDVKIACISSQNTVQSDYFTPSDSYSLIFGS